MDQSTWLSLSEAADLLGVHFTTLRRWTDLGLVEHIRTPGGKRKYSRKAIGDFLDRHRHEILEQIAPEDFENQAVSNTRKELSHKITDQKWYHTLSEDRRLHMRHSGNRLTALMFQYCSPKSGADAFLEEGLQIAREYGQFCYAAGMTLSECMRTFLFFRKTMLYTIHEAETVRTLREVESRSLFQRINHFLDEFLVGMLEGFEQPQ